MVRVQQLMRKLNVEIEEPTRWQHTVVMYCAVAEENVKRAIQNRKQSSISLSNVFVLILVLNFGSNGGYATFLLSSLPSDV